MRSVANLRDYIVQSQIHITKKEGAFTFDEMKTMTIDRWEFSAKATVYCPKEKRLLDGYTRIDASVSIHISYMGASSSGLLVHGQFGWWLRKENQEW